MSKAPPVAARRVFTDPVLFLAFGFGSGLAPKGPGTAGSVIGLGVAALAAQLGFVGYVMATVFVSIVGVWLCGEAARRLDSHDHPGIVWDEIAGVMITLAFVPMTLGWLALGFVFFRVFDIWKPWPIRELDHSIHGGLGIMLDDVVAGLFAAALLSAARFAPGFF